MCKKLPVIPVKRVVDTKRIIGKKGGPRRLLTLPPPQKKCSITNPK
jgi:hypothetical protein